MKRRPAPWQPPLLDLDRPATPEPPPPSPQVQPPSPPAPPPKPAAAPAGGDESPWWQRARQHVPAAPPPPEPPRKRRTEPTRIGFSAGGRWRRMMLDAGWFNELRPGDRKELADRVRGLEWRAGAIEGGVYGAGKPARVQLRLPSVTPAECARVARPLAESLAGERAAQVPDEIETAAEEVGVAVWPRRLHEVAATCTCGGVRRPCEHALAVHLAFAIRLEESVAPLLALRGLSAEVLQPLVDRIRADLARAAGEEAERVVDPFACEQAPPPDWSRVEGRPAEPLPLPDPLGWRDSEPFEALARRLVRGRPR